MKLVVIFGPQAVGKMTVGVELAKNTGLKLLHNHMTIDLVLKFFDWDSPQFALNKEFRTRIFEEVAASDLEGIVFTFIWSLNNEEDRAFIDSICAIFEKVNADIFFVELYAELSTRKIRNESAFRLQEKPTKRDLEHSRENLAMWHKQYKMNSNNDFNYHENYLFIDNTNISPQAVVEQIKDTFGL